MAKYRKKPIVIEAEVYKEGMEDGFICGNRYIPKDGDRYPLDMRSDKHQGYIKHYDYELDNKKENGWSPYIDTLEGKMIINEGDYIIIGIKGERYPCKSDIFEMTYEKVEVGE